MKQALIGAGGFAREIKAHMGIPEMICFVDDNYYRPNADNIYRISEFDPNEYEVLVTVGNPEARSEIISRLPKNTKYFSFVSETARILGEDVEIGEGSFIAAGCVLTTNIKLGKHTHLNLNTTIGHDCSIGDYFTTAPGVNISGNCVIGNRVYFGTNSSVRDQINIGDSVVIGMMSSVVCDIQEPGVYVGVPTRRLK